MHLPREKMRHGTARLVAWGLFLSTALGVTYYTHTVRAKSLYAQERLEAGEQALMAGDFERAEALLEEAVQANPRLLAAYELLAVAYESDGDTEKAYAQRQAAVEAGPQDAQAHYLLASAYVSDKRYSEAISELQRVIALDPGDGTALHLLARCYIWNGQPDKGVEVLEAMLARNPNDAVTQRGLRVARRRAASQESRSHAGL